MPDRSKRTIAVAAVAVVAVGAGAWGLTLLGSDDDPSATTDPVATEAPPAATEAAAASEATAAPAADDTTVSAPSNPSGIELEVSAGGPYDVGAGESLMLTSAVAVADQAELHEDLGAISDALDAYLTEHGSFPPAYLTDAAGQPTVSWRVLLLPYLGEQDLYDRFDLTKAWDDPANEALVAEMPAVFGNDQRDGAPGDTAYAGVTGPKTVFRSGAADLGGGVGANLVIDGVTMTLAVGPVGEDVAIPWSSPADVDISAHLQLGDPSGFDGPGTGVTPMLFLDGTVHSLLDETATDVVSSWSTIAGETCSPPANLALLPTEGWDFDADGTIDAYGPTVAFPTDDEGEHTVQLVVDDGLGGMHTVSTVVTVR